MRAAAGNQKYDTFNLHYWENGGCLAPKKSQTFVNGEKVLYRFLRHLKTFGASFCGKTYTIRLPAKKPATIFQRRQRKVPNATTADSYHWFNCAPIAIMPQFHDGFSRFARESDRFWRGVISAKTFGNSMRRRAGKTASLPPIFLLIAASNSRKNERRRRKS